MSNLSENMPSAFALIVDKLKDKSEEELKLLYIKFFSKELAEEWSSITETSNFENVSEEDIIKAIMKKRYGNKNV
jgi:hypothetical protein